MPVQTQATDNYIGIQLPIEDLAHTFANNGTEIISDSVVYNGYAPTAPNVAIPNVTYTLTYTYTAGFLATYSQWVPS